MQKPDSPSSQVCSELQSVSIATLGQNATAIQLFAVERPQVCTRTLLHCTPDHQSLQSVSNMLARCQALHSAKTQTTWAA